MFWAKSDLVVPAPVPDDVGLDVVPHVADLGLEGGGQVGRQQEGEGEDVGSGGEEGPGLEGGRLLQILLAGPVVLSHLGYHSHHQDQEDQEAYRLCPPVLPAAPSLLPSLSPVHLEGRVTSSQARSLTCPCPTSSTFSRAIFLASETVTKTLPEDPLVETVSTC